MIKDFEEYKAYRARLYDDDVSLTERKDIRFLMDEFEKANPEIFDKLNKEKWSGKGMKIIHPDGTVTIMG